MEPYEDGYRTGYDQALDDAESLADETFSSVSEKMNFRAKIKTLRKTALGGRECQYVPDTRLKRC